MYLQIYMHVLSPFLSTNQENQLTDGQKEKERRREKERGRERQRERRK